ncbi:MAG: CotH kinase family protein [Ilumatobacteraceae bacterium]
MSAAPFRPNPGDPIVVQARIGQPSSATLVYRVDFGPELTLPMADDDASVGGAGDGVVSAVIPAQVAGSLVRYRVEVHGADGDVSVPSAADSIRFLGVVVRDSTRRAGLPAIEWWMEDSVYDDLRANHRFDDLFGPAVIAYDGVVYDNVRMRVRGGQTRTLDHNSWHVEMPAGHLFDMPGLLTTGPVDEFNLQWDAFPVASMAWEIADRIGFSGIDYFGVQTYRNGRFWGAGSYSTNIDGKWRRDRGLDTGNVYKGDGYPALEPTPSPESYAGLLEIKEGLDDDYQAVWSFARGIGAGTPSDRHDYILDHVDVPRMVNYLALIGYLKHWDAAHHNWYLVNDAAGTDRWYLLPWDLDMTLKLKANTPVVGDYLIPDRGALPGAMFDFSDLEAMYFRRLKTLIDEYPLPQVPTQLFGDRFAEAAPDMLADYQLWHQFEKPDVRAEKFAAGVKERAKLFASKTGGTSRKPIPLSQSAERPIVITEIQYHPSSAASSSPS